MTQQHPVTPPLELVQQWEEDWHHSKIKHIELEPYIATRAAQWGADQELEALLVWLRVKGFDNLASDLLSARRPKPPSLKEQAMQALCRFMASEGHEDCTEEEIADDFTTIRRALEQLDD